MEAATVLKSSLNREYALRFLGVAVLFLALAGWFVYDGAVGYPAKNAEAQPVYQALAERNLTAADWMNTAKTGTAPLVTAFRDVTGKPPPSKISDTFTSWIRAQDPRAHQLEAAREAFAQPVYTADDIRAQWVSAVVAVLASLFLGLLTLCRAQTVYTMTDRTLTVRRWGSNRVYPLASLQQVDDREWTKRGIMRVRFASGTVTLDAWHHAGVRPMAERLAEHAAAPAAPAAEN